MANLNAELDLLMQSFKDKDPGSGIEGITPQAPAAPAVPTPVPTPATEPKAAPATVAPGSPAPAAPKPIDLDAIVDDWDTQAAGSPQPVITDQAAAQASQATVDFVEIAKSLNLQNVTDRETFAKAVSDLKTSSDAMGTLPGDLAKAVEIAKLGGNYLEYLNVTSVNWEAQDPVVLYENYVIDRFTNKEGLVDQDKVEKMLDAMSIEEKEFRGRELQNQYTSMQASQKQQLEFEAKRQRSQFEQSAQQAVNQLESISGFKLSASHKAEILRDILSGEDLKYRDLRSRAEAHALRKYYGKMDEYRRSQIKNNVLSKTLEEVTFPQLTKSGTPAAPAPDTKQPSWMSYLDSLQKQRGFK